MASLGAGILVSLALVLQVHQSPAGPRDFWIALGYGPLPAAVSAVFLAIAWRRRKQIIEAFRQGTP